MDHLNTISTSNEVAAKKKKKTAEVTPPWRIALCFLSEVIAEKKKKEKG